jgi:hypothetical protein
MAVGGNEGHVSAALTLEKDARSLFDTKLCGPQIRSYEENIFPQSIIELRLLPGNSPSTLERKGVLSVD